MKNKNLKSGYSLLELSIVIVIISILITGALSVSVGSINNIKVKTTKERMEIIYQAMGSFLVANGRLPCPASILEVDSSAAYGNEIDGDDGCDSSGGVFHSNVINADGLVYGMVPIRALRLANEMAEDAFGTRFSYIVDKDFTYSQYPSTPNFSNESFGTTDITDLAITVKENPSDATIIGDAIMVLVSHGSNKVGGFNPNSSTAVPRNSDIDEQTNDIGATPNESTNPDESNFDEIIINSSGNSDDFDDIILFKARDNFVRDFNAEFLIPCEGSPSANYGQIIYSTACIDPTRQITQKCGAGGNWISIDDCS